MKKISRFIIKNIIAAQNVAAITIFSILIEKIVMFLPTKLTVAIFLCLFVTNIIIGYKNFKE